MQIYIVGGAVRDQLLGLPVKDRDYVVVGAAPGQLLAQGFKPVGKDFPVFLHPDTHEEYALARTERKTAPGYTGFAFHAAPDVTLEQDLARRDLTINAIAMDDQGQLIDPFHGMDDLKAGVLRHVSPAFIEDPVRILRLARFAARFGFMVAEETMQLMRQMVEQGEVDALVPERVWQELAKGLMEATPSRMFLTLRTCGALTRILPALDRLFGVPQPAVHHPEIDTGDHVMRVVDYAASAGMPLSVRFAALMHDLGKGTTDPALWPSHHDHEARGAALVEAVCARLRVPNDCRDLARLVAAHHGNVHRAQVLRAGTILKLLQACDAFRKPTRFHDLLQACVADARGRLGFEDSPYPQQARLTLALEAAAAVDAGHIAQSCEDKATIPTRVAQARVEAIRRALNEPQD
ncbi:tRNA nucleotidyltransferase (CCA-adding enzyme) [Chitinivorax tropicus]|uniref:Multifunctional CCA protein n=1 Tax=Chitinivorax tropicus TaxID=714531 RepID=A0A840MPB9_9PROT|nr:multifunctional CCA addition/repair protein [Chitinivorax tropicus]MBB5018867.1 tRNA nucleotidyltransferase (CCA-adding enzyme) [Chitinivorax tropicus]